MHASAHMKMANEGDGEWNRFKNKMKEKRTANTRDRKKKEKSGCSVPGDTITVQRLSPEASGPGNLSHTNTTNTPLQI